MMLSKAFSTSTTPLREYRHGEDVFLDCDEAFIHTDAEEDGGGLACSDTELINSQRKIILDIGKQLGRKLLAGNLNLINISLPVVMFESRSYLQKLADPWVHPIHLERAAACSNPVERMKLTVTWFVAGLQHVFCSWRKPFNPLLGETWQAQLPSGTKIFTEQISHHPPVTAFHMDGRAGLYTFDGLSQPQVSFSSGGLKTSARGYRRITFASDGAVITIKYPYYRIGGLLSGVPHGLIKGSATLTDTRYNITATVNFGPVQGAVSRLLTRTDSLAVRIQGPAAAAAAVIAMPDWMTAAAASRPASAAASGKMHAPAAANGLDSSQVPATVAAAAAAALLAPLQDRQGCCSNMPSMVLSSSPAVASLSVNGYTTYRETASAPCSPQPFIRGTKSSRSSRYSTHSSHDSEDGSVTIHSRRRSKSSNLLSTDSLQWLGKPVKRLTSLSRSGSLKTSSSGGSSNTKPRRYSLSGLGLGACFGGGFSQDNDHCGGSSGDSSRSTSPEVSRINSSRSCPGAGGLCSAPTSPSGPQPMLGGSYSADGAYSTSGTLGSSTVQYKSSPNPKSRLGANSPQPSSWGSRSEVQVQAEAPQGTAAAGQDSSAAPAADSDSIAAASAAGATAAADAQRSEQSITSLSSSGSDSGAAHSCSSASNTQQQQKQQEQQQPGHDRQTLDRDQQQQQQQYYACQPQQLLASGTGNWLSHLDFGDQRYWTLADDPPEHWTSLCHLQQQQQQQVEEEEGPDGRVQAKLCPLHVLLPSDSQLRSDLVAFREGDPEAQHMKEQLEHQQRKDAKLRPSFSHIDCAQAD